MVIDALRSKIESFTAAGQFQSVDDVLNDVRELREQVQEGERTVEGKLKEVKSENDVRPIFCFFMYLQLCKWNFYMN